MLTETFVWPCDLACTLIIDNLVIPNFYSIKVSIEPIDTNSADINLGLKKLKYFVETYLQNAILINRDNNLVNSFGNLETNQVLVPGEPYDFVLGSTLYKKFCKITEKYFDIEHITIDSMVGDRIQYTISYENHIDLEVEDEHWWNTDSVGTGSNDHPSWEELDFKDSPKFSPTLVKGGLSEGR